MDDVEAERLQRQRSWRRVAVAQCIRIVEWIEQRSSVGVCLGVGGW